MPRSQRLRREAGTIFRTSLKYSARAIEAARRRRRNRWFKCVRVRIRRCWAIRVTGTVVSARGCMFKGATPFMEIRSRKSEAGGRGPLLSKPWDTRQRRSGPVPGRSNVKVETSRGLLGGVNPFGPFCAWDGRTPLSPIPQPSVVRRLPRRLNSSALGRDGATWEKQKFGGRKAEMKRRIFKREIRGIGERGKVVGKIGAGHACPWLISGVHSGPSISGR